MRNQSARLYRSIANRPMESVEFVIAVVTLIAGVWILSPEFHMNDNPVVRQGLQNPHLIKGLGVWLTVVSLPTIIAILRLHWPRRQKFRRLSTYTYFITYIFLALIRITVQGFGDIFWIPLIGLALISAVAHIKLKWELGDE